MSRLKTDAIRNVNASVDGITLDTSGNVAIPNELQLADKIVHTGDTNTFIRFPAADVIAFETGGTERLRINSDGRIWVNTQTGSSATELLRVENTGSASTNSRISIVSGGAAQAVLLFGDDQSFDQGQIVYSNSDHSMRFHANAGSERLRIDSDGRLRIGNTTQNQYTAADDLIVGSGSGNRGITIYSGSSDAGVIAFSDGTTDTAYRSGQILYDHNDDAMDFRTNGNYIRLKLTSTGQLEATSAADVRLTLGSSGTAGTNNSVHIRADSADLKFMAASGGNTIFETDGAEKLRIDSSGTVFIGTTTSHAGKFIVKDTDNSGNQIWVIGRANDNTGSISFRNNGDAAYTGRIQAGDTNGMEFNVAGSTRASLDTSGNFIVNDGNFKILTAGHGVDFSVTSNASGMSSELLDSYEEGTWTPTLYFSSGGDTATYTSNRGGWYVKVGRLVTCNGRIAISAKGSGSSAVYFGGLPFTVGNHNSGTSGVEGGLTISYLANVNADKGSGIIGGYASENTTQAVPFYVDTSNNFHYVEDFDLESDASIGFTISYCV